MEMKKVYFEKITILYYPVILICLIFRIKIYLFDFSHSMPEKKSKWLKKLIYRKKIKRILDGIRPESGIAIELADRIVDKIQSNRIQLKLLEIYQNNEIKLITKKKIANEVFKCIYIHNYIVERKQLYKKNVLFFPVDYFYISKLLVKYGGYKLEDIHNYINVSSVALPFLYLRRIVLKAVLCFILLVLIFQTPRIKASKILRHEEKCENIKSFKYAVFLNNIITKNKVKGKRSFDFILDNKKLTKNNTLFLVSTKQDKEWIKEKINDGFNIFVYAEGIKNLIKLKIKEFKIFNIKGIEFSIVTGILLPLPILLSCVESYLYYFRWCEFFKTYHAINYIYSNRETGDQIAFNILARANKSKTHCYSSFVGGGVLYAKNENYLEVRQLLWSFLNSDIFYATNDNVIDYYKLHHQNVNNYITIGNIYSEMVMEYMREIEKVNILKKYFPGVTLINQKIISYYDTSFIDDDVFPTTYDDAIASYKDMLKLLEEFNECLMIVKPSKFESYYISKKYLWASKKKGEILIELFDKVKNHQRVYWAGADGDSPLIMAMSDLVITHCMSSPTVEALGAGIKAIWYESNNKHCDILYDNIPGLIIHGYRNLRNRVDELLYNTDEQNYRNYLETYIKGRVEGLMDGKALTRLRTSIAEKKEFVTIN